MDKYPPVDPIQADKPMNRQLILVGIALALPLLILAVKLLGLTLA